MRALPLLKQVFPELRLRALTALYPSQDSEQYYREIQALVETLGLKEAIDLDVDYHPIENVIDRLAEADLVVLPYAASDEGGSGSLAIAMAARSPLLISRAAIFEELAGSAYVTESTDPNVLAVAILNVLSNGNLRETLKRSAADAASRASWRSVAQEMRVCMNMRS
jgi:glycosyltransferase involved in cell wall biosynthesis